MRMTDVMVGAASVFRQLAVIVTLLPGVIPKPAVLNVNAPTAGLESAAELSVKLPR